MSLEILQPHLLEELTQLHDDCELEDIELQRDLKAYIEKMQTQTEAIEAQLETPVYESTPVAEKEIDESADDGMMTIDSSWSKDDVSFVQHEAASYQPTHSSFGASSTPVEFEAPEVTEEEDLPVGQGKDHFDLGIVYAEMKLWDAAVTEFQTARRDRSIRAKATIELANCLKNSNDPRRALRILEEETSSTDAEAGVQDDLNYHMGALNEALGNVEAAISCLEKVNAGTTHGDDAVTLLHRLRAQ